MTTYVLGAGASRHAGYPLANTMGRELTTWMRNASIPYLEAATAAQFLEDTFGRMSDFEELLTQIASLIAENEHGTPSQRAIRAQVAQARSTLTQSLREWFAKIARGDATTYHRFASEIIQPEDWIIDFNYDVSLDRELAQAAKWKPGDGYGFTIQGFPANSPVKLLKLHGSVNWLALLFGGAKAGAFAVGSGGAFGERPVIPQNELAFLGRPDLRDPAFPDKSAALPVMILPAQKKEFFWHTNLGTEWEGFWDALWGMGETALEQSDKIMICGYSLPAADERARSLLFQAPYREAQILVASGSDTARIVKEFQNAGYANAVAAQEVSFEKLVESLATQR